VDRAGYVPQFILLAGTDVKKRDSLFLVEILRRNLFDSKAAQEAKKPDDEVECNDAQ